jgi:hypothetical protein
MEPGTFEDDDDRRTERTVIGAELTGRVNGLRLLIMRGRGCADCQKGCARQKACDRKRRDGRTAHPNCPFNPTRCAGHTRGHAMRHRSAGGIASPGDRIVRTADIFPMTGVNPNAPLPTNDARVNHVGPTRTDARSTYQNAVRSRGRAGFQARPHHAALRAPTGETCRRCMGSYSRRQLFACSRCRCRRARIWSPLHRVTDVFSARCASTDRPAAYTVQDYLAHGRRFVGLDMERLNKDWIVAVRGWLAHKHRTKERLV